MVGAAASGAAAGWLGGSWAATADFFAGAGLVEISSSAWRTSRSRIRSEMPNRIATPSIAPVGAVNKLLKKIGWSVKDVDLWEVNEAFAVVPMAAMKELGIGHDIVNVNGGACALGHPIGASGARIIVTLIHALQARGLKKGVATLCIGGGEGTALALEII